NPAQKGVHAAHIGMPRQSRCLSRILKLRRQSLGDRENVFQRYPSALDRQQSVAKISLGDEPWLSLTKPMNRRGNEADQVVGVLGAQFSRELQFGCTASRKLDQRIEIVRAQEALIEERPIELLHILLGLHLRIGLRRGSAGG